MQWTNIVNMVDFGSSSPGSSPGLEHCIVSLICFLFFLFFSRGEGAVFITVSLSSQVYKWITGNLMLGDNAAMDWHPIEGESSNTPSPTHYKTRITSSGMGHLALCRLGLN